MTVALVGVGADPSNCSPTPPVYEDGTFEFVPPAESRGSAGTTEPRTFGNTRLRHRDSVMADYLESVRPRGEDGPEVTGVQLANWPLHYDPNFRARTYGETEDRGDYVAVLSELSSGDAVAFYAVLEPEGGGASHRYLIAHFTVESVVDFRDVEGDGTPFGDLPGDEREALVETHADNAHVKRHRATGEDPAGEGLVVVDGTDPGAFLETAVRISEHGGGGHYYLTDEMQAALDPEPDGNPEKNAYLGGEPKAHLLDVSSEAFREVLD